MFIQTKHNSVYDQYKSYSFPNSSVILQVVGDILDVIE